MGNPPNISKILILKLSVISILYHFSGNGKLIFIALEILSRILTTEKKQELEGKVGRKLLEIVLQITF